MDRSTLVARAEAFRQLHHASSPLILANVWDPLGAKLMERTGFPAVATSSAAVAFSLGYDDGQLLRWDAMREAIRQIAAAVSVPVTADVERGFAEEPKALAENMRQVWEAGAVGINLEDSLVEGGELRPLDQQCERIHAVREMAIREGVPLVINARVDVFLRSREQPDQERVQEVQERGNAYLESGADCVYPIPVGDLETLKAIGTVVRGPLNAYGAADDAATVQELADAGVQRISLGTGVLRASFTAMQTLASELHTHGTYGSLRNAHPSSAIIPLLQKTPMSD